MIEVGDIITNLVPTEPTRVTSVKKLGGSYSIGYIGINSNRSSSKIVTSAQMEALEKLTQEGAFNFKGNAEQFVLFAEAERINSAYQFDPLFAINCSVVDPLPHQVEAVYKYLLPQPKIRFLLADDTGAGKTIMTGLLIKELLMRHMVERILIVTPGGLTKQWQEDEMGMKFNIPFKLVNRGIFASEPNIFQTADRIVTSIDFVCREDVMNVLSMSNWDMVIIDEAHKLSAYEYGEKLYRSKRYEVAQMLAGQCEHMLLLTATPHRGRSDTFKKLMQLLDEDIFATADLAAERVKELGQNGVNKFFIRRLKEDMKDWDGNPLYKARHTKTISYDLTPEEERLYRAVTEYLTPRKEAARESKNIHVALALQVMQRRLTSSIFAIKNTLERRWTALQSLVDMLQQNPQLWKQKQRLDDIDVDNLDDYDDLDDEQKDKLDDILSDPRKFRMFTTAGSMADLTKEAAELKHLYEMASELYTQQREEKKYQELKSLLLSQGVVDGEKLVVFTEHKDTLLYLQERLSNNGYAVAVIHGGMSVDERREAQYQFMTGKAQILIATDAAGEGINLQFCRLLINWDIPWNPNRLEQRMGRVHRYGQKNDVMVFNMVAANTREGQVLTTLLTKLDLIREHLGDDRVYDVIQDVLKDVSLDDILQSVLGGKESELDRFISQGDDQLQNLFAKKIDEQDKSLSHSTVDFATARELKEDSDERRLQPIFIRLFFERAYRYLGGSYEEVQPGIYRITHVPDVVAERLKNDYRIYTDNLRDLLFCFDKHLFLDYQLTNPYSGKAHYINPGNPLFDSLIDVVRDNFRGEALMGTVLVSPEDSEPYFAYFVKNQILDNRPSRSSDSVANELLTLVCQDGDGRFASTSPAKLLDLCPPSTFAKEVTPPDVTREDEVLEWCYTNITEPLFEETRLRVEEDSQRRLEYLRTAFQQVILDVQCEINELQGKALLQDDEKTQRKLQAKTARYEELKQKQQRRLAEMTQMEELSPKAPEVMGCAYVVPLGQMEYRSTFGMSRDDEVEAIGMRVAMEYEQAEGRTPKDVSKDNVGYDIRSLSPSGQKRYIEVKGRAGTDGVMLSENEMNRLAQLGDRAWLYIVIECKGNPQLFCIQNPACTMQFEQKSKGVQYYLPLEEWKKRIENN